MSDRTWVILELSPAGERVSSLREISDSLKSFGADNVFVPAVSATYDNQTLISWMMEGYVFVDVRSYIIPKVSPAPPWTVATFVKNPRSQIKQALLTIFKRNPGVVFTTRNLVDMILEINPDCLTRETHTQKQQVVYTALGRMKEANRSSGPIKGRFWMGKRSFHPKDLEASPFVLELMCDHPKKGGTQIHYLSQAKIDQFRRNLQQLFSQFKLGQSVRILGGIHRNLEGEVTGFTRDTVSVIVHLDTMTSEIILPKLFVEPV